MADSLLLAHHFELLGGGVVSNLPMCAGAIFRLGTQYTFGSPQPVIDFTMSLMGDGERPVGWRMSNRSFDIPVVIIVPNTGDPVADRLTLAGAREAILSAIDVDEFQLQWAPDGSNGARNTVFECWRAKAATVTYDVKNDKQRLAELVLSFDAMPYGRSDDLSYLYFDSPLAGDLQPLVPVVIDDYSTVGSSTQGAWWSQAPVSAAAYGTQVGNWSAKWDHTLSDQNSPMVYTRTLPVPVDITGRTHLTFWLGLGCDPGSWRKWHKGPVAFQFTLTDGSGRTVTWGMKHQELQAAANNNWPKWNRLSTLIPVGPVSGTITTGGAPRGGAFDLTSISAYSIRVWSETRSWVRQDVHVLSGFLSWLAASPHAAPRRVASERGGEYVLQGIVGTAPTQLNIHAQLCFQTLMPSTKTYNLPGTPGSTHNYIPGATTGNSGALGPNPNWLFGDTANFEHGTKGTWTGNDGLATNCGFYLWNGEANTGQYSLQINPSAAGNVTCASWPASSNSTLGVPCQAGDKIRVGLSMKVGTSGTGRVVNVGAEFFNAANASLGAVYAPAATGSATAGSAWQQLYGTVTAPANAQFARLLPQVIGMQVTPATDTVFLDDLYIAPCLMASVITEGGGGAGGGVSPNWTTAGGGGGGEISWETQVELTPYVPVAVPGYPVSSGQHQYGRGSGGMPLPASDMPVWYDAEPGAPGVTFGGSWGAFGGTGYLNRQMRATTTTGNTCTFKFKGTSVAWLGTRGPSRGIANVSLDGGAAVAVDCYNTYGSDGPGFCWQVQGLSNTAHTLKITCTGTFNGSATAPWVGVDAFVVNHNLIMTDDTDPAITYTGGFTAFSMGPSYWQQTDHSCSASGTASFTFNGTGCVWYGFKGNNHGIATVQVDGGTAVTVDTYAVNQYIGPIWQVTGLAPGNHTVLITATNTKNANSSANWVDVDAIGYWGHGSGGSGGRSWFQGTTMLVQAAGGKGGANVLIADYSSGPGGAGGNGGAGGATNNPTLNAGGGGGGGSDVGAGNVGGTPGFGLGGNASAFPVQGGAGGAGAFPVQGGAGGAGQHSGGGDGYKGEAPGGGGGGASCQIYPHAGGQGGSGLVQVRVTHWNSVRNTLPAVIVHKPRHPNVLEKPVLQVGAGLDVPNGREFMVPRVAGFHARYRGTYTVLLVAYAWHGTAARQVTVTVRQYEAAGGAVSLASVAQSIVPGGVANQICNLGEITLPVKDMADDNTDSYFTVAVTSGDTADRFLDVLLLNTEGSLAWISLPGAGYADYYVDAPELGVNVGRVLGSMDDRDRAVSVLGSTLLTGGPFRLVPGENIFTVYSPSGMPALQGEYWPRWWAERLS